MSALLEKNEDSTKRKISSIPKKIKLSPPVGLEPTTLLEVQHANPLRHGGFMC